MIEFEKKYKNILESLKEWGFLRIYFRPYFNKSGFSKRKKKLSDLLSSFFFGFKNFFNQYDYLFFSDTKERRKINGLFIDKYADDIIDRLNGKTLLFELPVPSHFKNSKTRYIVSEIWVYFLAKLLSVFIKSKNIKELEEILKRENLDINYKKFIKEFYSKYFIYKFFLKLYKPKAIFVNCYYCRISLIKAAKDLNIKVIEIQHGLIENHDMYIKNIHINESYIPDVLLSWGDVGEIIIKKIEVIGSWYIDYLKKNFNCDKKIDLLKQHYKYAITVSLQDIDKKINKKFFDFLNNLNKEFLFFLIPRSEDINYNFSENIKVIRGDCYKILLNSDFHMSLYSSCAVEAPALNKPNILVNIGDFASKYFTNLEFTKIIASKEEFIKAIEDLKDLKEIDKHYKLIVLGYEEKIEKFLRKLYENKI